MQTTEQVWSTLILQIATRQNLGDGPKSSVQSGTLTTARPSVITLRSTTTNGRVKFPANVQHEIDVSRDEHRGDFKDLKGLPMPQAPITIATTRYPKDNDTNLSLAFDQRKYLDWVFDYRMSSLTENSPVRSRTELSSPLRVSGQCVQDDEPDLVNWAMERVLQVQGRLR